MQQWHVYEDWTLEEQPRCFYVGKGDDDRINKVQRNRFHADVVSLYGHERRVVFSTSDESQALLRERELIVERHTHPRDENYNGIGCNRTLGGQGNSGRIVSEETCKKISEAKVGKTPNKVWSQEERDATSARMSILHKGKKISDEQKTLLKKRMNDPSIKQSMVKKVSLALKKRYQENDVFREKIRLARTGERNANAILTEHDVREIRAAWDVFIAAEHHDTVKSFCTLWATKFKLTNENIYGIVKRKTWKHVV